MTAGQASRTGRPTRAAADEMHEGILAAAMTLFIQEGFSASMDSVAAAAKVSKRTLYARYPSKQHLYAAVLHWLLGDLGRPITALSSSVPLDEALLAFSEALLDHYRQSNVAAFSRLIEKERGRFPDLELANRQQFIEDIVMPLKAFLDGRVGNELRTVDTMVAAISLCGIVITEISRMFSSNCLHDDEGFRTFMKSAIGFLLNGIRT